MKISKFFLISLLCFSLFSCASDEGKVINGNGTVTVGLTYFKDTTTGVATRIHHYKQGFKSDEFSEVLELGEDKTIQKGATLETLAVDSPILEGFSPIGITMAKDSDGTESINVYYQRNLVTLTFNLLQGENSKGENKSTVTGLYEAPLDVKKDVDLGNSYFIDHEFGPKAFPATDTTYDLNVATIPKYLDEKLVEGGSFIRCLNNVDYKISVDSFCVAAIEFPQYLWEQIKKENPSHFQGKLRGAQEGENQDFRPVENVSWFDCIYICNELSIKEGLIPAYSLNGETNPGKWGEIPEDFESKNIDKWNSVEWNRNATGYRLLTEAEWEYAARGGKLSQSKIDSSNSDYIFAGSNEIGDIAWNVKNSSAYTHQCALLKPNELGLYDLSGNVDEWCWDIYSEYPEEDSINPVGGDRGAYRVKRGGNYYSGLGNDSEKSYFAVSTRNKNLPYRRTSGFGLRLAKNAPLGAIVEKVSDSVDNAEETAQE